LRATRIVPLIAVALLLLGAGPRSKAERSEERAWSQVEAAAEQDAAQRLLDRAEEYLATFPDGEHRLEVRRLAGGAAMELELWTACRRHGDAYLADGGREGIDAVAFRVAICLSREGRAKDAVPALRNAAAHDEDEGRAAQAARELVAQHMFAGEWRQAIDAQELLLTRNLFDPNLDLADSRKAAESISDGALELMEQESTPLIGGLLAYLRLERAEQLVQTEETEQARRRFADRYPDHPMIEQVPGAATWAAEPEDTNPRAIGVLLPTSGRYSGPGELAMRGIQLAIDEVRAQESLGMQDLVLVPIDTAGDPEAAAEGLRRLVEVERVIAVLGPIVGDEAEVVAAAADELGVPLLMMTQRSGLAEGKRGVFNTWVTAEEQVDAIVEHAVERMGIQTFAIAYPDRETGGNMAGRFWDGVEGLGGKVAAVESYTSGATDYRETARRLIGSFYGRKAPAEADLVLPWLGDRARPHLTDPMVELEPGLDFGAMFLPDNFKAAAMAAPGFLYEQINVGGALSESRGLPVALLGGAAFNHPDLLERAGRYANGMVFVDGFFAGSWNPAVQRFVLSYEQRWEAQPMALEATAYDATLLLCQLLVNGAETRRDLRARLALAAPARSVMGSRGFGSDGEMRHDLLVLEVKKEKIVQVFPEPPTQPMHLEITQEGEIVRYKLGPDKERILVDEDGDPLEPEEPAPEGEPGEAAESEEGTAP
jgi:ABC-type branched-subunit amino acid transport system substrate-binding protein